MVSEYLIGLREATWVPVVAIHFGCLVHTTLVLRDGVVHRQEDLVRSRKTTAHPAPGPVPGSTSPTNCSRARAANPTAEPSSNPANGQPFNAATWRRAASAVDYIVGVAGAAHGPAV